MYGGWQNSREGCLYASGTGSWTPRCKALSMVELANSAGFCVQLPLPGTLPSLPIFRSDQHRMTLPSTLCKSLLMVLLQATF